MKRYKYKKKCKFHGIREKFDNKFFLRLYRNNQDENEAAPV